MNGEQPIPKLSNSDLLKSLENYFESERKTTHMILLHLKEIQFRKLYADHGFPDLFSMLIEYFHQSESAANQRIQALRLMNDVPEVETGLIAGELNLSTLAMAQRQIRREEKITGVKIQPAKKTEIVQRITCKTMAEAEKELMQMLPQSSKAPATQERRISADAIRLSLTIPNRVKEKLEQLKNCWAAVDPSMEYLEVIERALDIALAKVDPLRKGRLAKTKKDLTRKKLCATESIAQQNTSLQPAFVDGMISHISPKPRAKRKKYYSVQTNKIIWERAGSQCEYVDIKTNRRCSSRFGLERDHIKPLALGGTNEIQNLRLLCRAHNQFMARRFGLIK